VGTFLFMATFGFSLNMLSLFGLVLAVGIVVDDAIVVVENVERNIAAGLSPREAARRSMDEVGSALVAIALVLCAVFVPAAFITGISGQFYRQFALTIAGATVISLIVSLTLSPAMAALLLKPHVVHHSLPWWQRPLRAFFQAFNRGFEALGSGYGWLTARVVRLALIMLVVYAGVIGFGLNEFRRTPVGFIPQLDAGYLIASPSFLAAPRLRARMPSTAKSSTSHCKFQESRTPSTLSVSRVRPSPTPPTPAPYFSSWNPSSRAAGIHTSPLPPSKAPFSRSWVDFRKGSSLS